MHVHSRVRYRPQSSVQMHLLSEVMPRTVGPPMNKIHNGMPANELFGAVWQKSRRSNSQGNCVEFAGLPEGAVAMRNSRHPDGPALVYTRDEIAAMILGAKDGDFDYLLEP